MKLSSVLGLGMCAAFTFGCAGESAPPPATQPAAPATTAAAPPAAAPAASSTVADGDFGVPACDQYMRKYVACVDSKVPETSRAMMRQSLDQTKAQWKQAASTPQGRDSLKMACEQAEAAAKQSMAMYGCAW